MTKINTRTTVAFITVETTENTPVYPSSAGQAVALQDDFAITPGIEQIDNLEIKASLAKSKAIIGRETPSANLSHYLRHSGVEGQAPNYKQLLKAAFGTETVNSTEYNTVASSTTSAINVDTGEGANFSRGQGLLVKDGTNGYSIVPVHSISSDVLTPGFNLANAPGTGVNLGKAVVYSPANSDHQTLSLFEYLGNGGAIQLVSGVRVTNITINFEAGQPINATYTLEGVQYRFNPVFITESNQDIDFVDDDGTQAVTVPVGVYANPHELATAIQDAMNTESTDTFTVTYSDSTGKFTFASDGSTFSLLWKSGTSGSDNTDTHIGTLLGFSDAADDTGSTSYTSDNAMSFAAPYTPSYDSADPLVAKSNKVMIGDATDNSCFEVASVTFTLGTPKADLPSVCADSGIGSSLITERTTSIQVVAYLQKYDVDQFKRFKEGTETRFAYVGGVKSGGNWVAGKCFCLYQPTTTITNIEVTKVDGVARLEMELQGYVSGGLGETYLSFL